MSGVKFHYTSGEVSLVAATAKTVLQATAAANHRALLKRVDVSFKGVSTTDTPVLVQLARTTTAGTGTAATAAKNSPGDDETVQTTAASNYSAEPTYGDILNTWEVHPQTGQIIMLPFSDEVIVPGSGRIAVRCTAVQNQTVAVNFYMDE